MKFVLVLGVLCLVVLATAKKADKSSEDNVDNDWSTLEKADHHQAKKYSKASKHHHHSKHQKPLDNSEHKHHGRIESKKAKHTPKQAPHEIPPQEAELQADLHTSKKHLKNQHFKDAQQDLHLQDLSFEESLKKKEEQNVKSPHQYQRGHHKTSHHFADSKDTKVEQSPSEAEKKLFVDHSPKEQQNKPPHPILEDSFETLQDDKTKQGLEEKKRGKKFNKHKKPKEQTKQGKKSKNSKKEKKNKKEKKQKKW